MSDSATIEILNADQVAALLGVDRKSVYDGAARREIPHRRLGRRLLFERGTILRWLAGDVGAGDPTGSATSVPIGGGSRRRSAGAKRLRPHRE